MPGRRIAAVLLLGAAAAASAQSLPPGVRGPSSGLATRSVSVYLGLERELAAAIDDRDAATADRLLDDAFRVRTAGSDDASSKAEWWGAPARGRATAVSTVRDLTVDEFGDVAIVTFVRETLHRRVERSPLGRVGRRCLASRRSSAADAARSRAARTPEAPGAAGRTRVIEGRRSAARR